MLIWTQQEGTTYTIVTYPLVINADFFLIFFLLQNIPLNIFTIINASTLQDSRSSATINWLVDIKKYLSKDKSQHCAGVHISIGVCVICRV